MFDFIKRMFSGSKSRAARAKNVGQLDVVEGNDIEVLKTSDYSEGAPAEAIEQLVAEHEVPPAELNLPAAESEMPTFCLDEPTSEMVSDSSSEDELEAQQEPSPAMAEEADNYLLGDLEAARKQRDMQTRKAGIQYWAEGLEKYRPRHERAADGTTGRQSNYFDVLREEPMLRQVELQRPGMSIDQLNLSKFMNDSMKGKMLHEFVLRSLRLIRDQEQNGVRPEWSNDTAAGALAREAHKRALRDMFNTYEAQRRESTGSGDMATQSPDSEHIDLTEDQIDELLHHFEELFELTRDDDNKDSYNRWLLAVAEEATASDEILWLLVEDENPDVRFCLAENYNIDQKMLQKLSEDENPYVAFRAQKTLVRLQSSTARVVDHNFGSGDNRMRKSG
ncbi:MAG TPA: hypothetical protein V6C89_10985 [Drouetiella sp.]|jgi:hypothetical protein